MSRAQVRWVDDNWCVVTKEPIDGWPSTKHRVPGFWRRRYVYRFGSAFKSAVYTAEVLNQN